MGFQEKTVLKTYFNTDDIPTESNFVDLIDSIPPIAYASISAESNATTTTFGGTSTDFTNKSQVTIFDTNGANSGATPDHTSGHITIDAAGDYDIRCKVCFSGGISDTYSMSVFKNNGATQLGPRMTRMLGTGGDVGSAMIEADIVTLALNDTIEVWAQNEDDTTALTVQEICLKVIQVG